MAEANSVNTAAQPENPFRVAVKVRLVELGMSVTQLATRLGLSRNAVSLAINHEGLFAPTKQRIKEELGL